MCVVWLAAWLAGWRGSSECTERRRRADLLRDRRHPATSTRYRCDNVRNGTKRLQPPEPTRSRPVLAAPAALSARLGSPSVGRPVRPATARAPNARAAQPRSRRFRTARLQSVRCGRSIVADDISSPRNQSRSTKRRERNETRRDDDPTQCVAQCQ